MCSWSHDSVSVFHSFQPFVAWFVRVVREHLMFILSEHWSEHSTFLKDDHPVRRGGHCAREHGLHLVRGRVVLGREEGAAGRNARRKFATDESTASCVAGAGTGVPALAVRALEFWDGKSGRMER